MLRAALRSSGREWTRRGALTGEEMAAGLADARAAEAGGLQATLPMESQ